MKKFSGSIVKNFILSFGRKLIDFMTIFNFSFAFLIFITICIFYAIGYTISLSIWGNYFYVSYYYKDTTFETFLISMLIPLIIIIATVFSNYFIYLLIDIRESLKKIKGDK